jgi:hypothetical protein
MRGAYQKPQGSGIWWINYHAAGKRHREKVGRKSDAIKLYQLRKADVIAGRKMPELRDSKVARFSELIDDVLERWLRSHYDFSICRLAGDVESRAKRCLVTARPIEKPGCFINLL